MKSKPLKSISFSILLVQLIFHQHTYADYQSPPLQPAVAPNGTLYAGSAVSVLRGRIWARVADNQDEEILFGISYWSTGAQFSGDPAGRSSSYDTVIWPDPVPYQGPYYVFGGWYQPQTTVRLKVKTKAMLEEMIKSSQKGSAFEVTLKGRTIIRYRELSEEKTYNIWFEDDDSTHVPQGVLFKDKSYRLYLNISDKSTKFKFLSPAMEPSPTSKLDEISSPLCVMLFADAFEPMMQVKYLHLSTSNPSNSIRFLVRPAEAGQAKFSLLITKNGQLVDRFSLVIHVSADGNARLPSRLSANLSSTVASTYPLTLATEKAYPIPISFNQNNAIVRRDAPPFPNEERPSNAYQVSLYAPDYTKPLRLCLINLANFDTHCADTSISPAELKNRQDYLSQTIAGVLEKSELTDNKRDLILKDLALMGSGLYKALFEGDQGLKRLMDAIRTHAANTTAPISFKIIDATQHTSYIPWQFLYDGPYKSFQPDKYDPQSFWGYRFILNYSPYIRYGLGAEIDNCGRFNLMFVGYQDGDDTFRARLKEQSEFFASFGELLNQKPINGLEQFINSLTEPKPDDIGIMYFYTHGVGQVDAITSKSYGGVVGEPGIYFDSRTVIQPSHLRDLPTTIDEISGNPLLFVNACESASVITSNYDMFIERFANLGVRGYLGTEGKIPQVDAKDFAVRFFTKLFKRQPVGFALYELRREYLERKDPVALLYTYFGSDKLGLKCTVNSAKN